jgi:hypothetical protein
MENEKILDLIDRNELLEAEFLISEDGVSGYVIDSEIVRRAKRVDAVEVVHAHWEDGWGEDCYGNIAYKSIDCSHCEEIFKIESYDREYWKKRFKVCPFCGAVMDGGNEDDT